MRLIPLEPRPFTCGYFDDRQATYEHYYMNDATLHERELLLAYGYRSFGRYTFRPQCGACQRCVPLRVLVRHFYPNKSQRRVLKKGQELRITVGPPEYNEEKLKIYLAHGQRFSRATEFSGEEEFRQSFYEPAVPTLEFCYYHEEQLVAVGIVHETPRALSSVYFTYLPDYGQLSLGTFSVLQEIAFAASHGKQYLYLGYYIRDNRFMRYKKSFYPSEVLPNEQGWVPFRDRRGGYFCPDELTFEPFPVFS